jgi:uncharacterized HAD superfamily protein
MEKIKICAIDLDGVLCEYPNDWICYVREKTDLDVTTLVESKAGLSWTQYEDLKKQYRLSGRKSRLKVVSGAQELLNNLRKQGYLIIILTSRPIYEYPEVFRDTLLWLKNNKIAHDLLFGGGKDKHIQILKYFPDLKFMIEDNSSIAYKIATAGYRCYLLHSTTNATTKEVHDNLIRINTLAEVMKYDID